MSHKKDELEVPGINAVLEDLKAEQKRFQDRKDRLKGLGVDAVSNKEFQLAFIDAKLDYLELLIRRYQSWK